jgi:hypothetical protein
MSDTATTRNPTIRAALGVAVAVTLVLAGSANGSPRSEARSRKAIPQTGCPDAGRTEVTVPDGIDGIRVFATDGRPGAATDITVLAGGRDRTVRAFGGGVFGLELDEPLRARRVQVALEPVLDAPSGACVSRVELLRGGAVVATVF